MTDEDKKIHRAYIELELTDDERNALYDLWMRGYNAEDGHVWVRWLDVERLMVELKEMEKTNGTDC